MSSPSLPLPFMRAMQVARGAWISMIVLPAGAMTGSQASWPGDRGNPSRISSVAVSGMEVRIRPTVAMRAGSVIAAGGGRRRPSARAARTSSPMLRWTPPKLWANSAPWVVLPAPGGPTRNTPRIKPAS